MKSNAFDIFKKIPHCMTVNEKKDKKVNTIIVTFFVNEF